MRTLILVLLVACSGRSLPTPELAQRAKAAHREAQKTENVARFVEADQLYREYLARVPDDDDMTFFHAECLFKLAEHQPQPAAWQRAADEYERVVKMKPAGAHVKEAAYAHVISTLNALGLDNGPSDGGAVPPRFLQALDLYIDHVPDNPQRVVMQYRKARTLYEADRYDEAAPIFADIAVKHPEHELAVYSANLLLDCLNVQHKTAELEAWADRLAKGPLMKNADFAASIEKIKNCCK